MPYMQTIFAYIDSVHYLTLGGLCLTTIGILSLYDKATSGTQQGRTLTKDCKTCGTLLRNFVEVCPNCGQNPDVDPLPNIGFSLLYLIVLAGVCLFIGWAWGVW